MTIEILFWGIIFFQQIAIIALNHQLGKAFDLARALDKDLNHVENFLQNTKFVVSEEE